MILCWRAVMPHCGHAVTLFCSPTRAVSMLPSPTTIIAVS